MVPTDNSKTIIADLDKQIIVVLKLQILYSRLFYLFKNIYKFFKTLRFVFSFRKEATSAALLNTAFLKYLMTTAATPNY